MSTSSKIATRHYTLTITRADYYDAVRYNLQLWDPRVRQMRLDKIEHGQALPGSTAIAIGNAATREFRGIGAKVFLSDAEPNGYFPDNGVAVHGRNKLIVRLFSRYGWPSETREFRILNPVCNGQHPDQIEIEETSLSVEHWPDEAAALQARDANRPTTWTPELAAKVKANESWMPFGSDVLDRVTDLWLSRVGE